MLRDDVNSALVQLGKRATEEQARLRVLARCLVLDEICAERAGQDEKWGQQDHPDGTGPDLVWMAAESRDEARTQCDDRFARGAGTWMDILEEEVSEAFAESDPPYLRAELVQVAAVAVAWIEAIDRRLAAEPVEVPGG